MCMYMVVVMIGYRLDSVVVRLKSNWWSQIVVVWKSDWWIHVVVFVYVYCECICICIISIYIYTNHKFKIDFLIYDSEIRFPFFILKFEFRYWQIDFNMIYSIQKLKIEIWFWKGDLKFGIRNQTQKWKWQTNISIGGDKGILYGMLWMGKKCGQILFCSPMPTFWIQIWKESIQ